jgi:hypothetical protein
VPEKKKLQKKWGKYLNITRQKIIDIK